MRPNTRAGRQRGDDNGEAKAHREHQRSFGCDAVILSMVTMATFRLSAATSHFQHEILCAALVPG